jgi:hypothetical protein
MHLKESTIEVIREKIEFSKLGVKIFREGEQENWDDKQWRNIYRGLASIIESYASCFEFILREEEVQVSITPHRHDRSEASCFHEQEAVKPRRRRAK